MLAESKLGHAKVTRLGPSIEFSLLEEAAGVVWDCHRKGSRLRKSQTQPFSHSTSKFQVPRLIHNHIRAQMADFIQALDPAKLLLAETVSGRSS
jgi:hypothetical protein